MFRSERTTAKPLEHDRATISFIHKIGICENEAAETAYWLELAPDAKLIALTASDEVLREVQELPAIFVASGRTAKSR